MIIAALILMGLSITAVCIVGSYGFRRIEALERRVADLINADLDIIDAMAQMTRSAQAAADSSAKLVARQGRKLNEHIESRLHRP